MVTVCSVRRCKCYLEMSDLRDAPPRHEGSSNEPVIAVEAANQLLDTCMDQEATIGKQKQMRNITDRSVEGIHIVMKDAVEIIAGTEPTDPEESLRRATMASTFLTRLLKIAFEFSSEMEDMFDQDDKAHLEDIIKQLTEGRRRGDMARFVCTCLN